MNNIVMYKGYKAIVKYSEEDNTYYGKVLDIDDTILFEISNLNNIVEFEEVIEDYLRIKEE